MKKLLAIVVLGLVLASNALADDINELNNKLIEIENRMDNCLNTKDKELCDRIIMENPILEILGNQSFAKLLMSPNHWGVGTKCGATNARILSKTNKIASFVMQN